MILYIFGYEDLKDVVIFLKFWIFHHFLEKSKFWLFFKNSVFENCGWKFVNILLLWVSSIKKYKYRNQCLRKLSKKLLNLLRVLRGKLTLRPPHGTFASALNCKKWLFVQCRYRTNFWKCQIKLDLLSRQTPPRARTICDTLL